MREEITIEMLRDAFAIDESAVDKTIKVLNEWDFSKCWRGDNGVPLYLRDQRKRLKLTQAQLARRLNLTVGHVSKVERGEVPAQMIYVMALECLMRRQGITELDEIADFCLEMEQDGI